MTWLYIFTYVCTHIFTQFYYVGKHIYRYAQEVLLYQAKSSWLSLFIFSWLPHFFSFTPYPFLWPPVLLWPGVARNTGAVIWTAGRSISQGPRRCEIWDTFHSTLPSFWQKERDSTKPGEHNRREAVIYIGVKSQTSLSDPGSLILSSIVPHWIVFLIDWGKGELIFVILTCPLWVLSTGASDVPIDENGWLVIRSFQMTSIWRLSVW